MPPQLSNDYLGFNTMLNEASFKDDAPSCLRARVCVWRGFSYEADAQLAYMSRHGLADLVITEDSDALVFGCRRVLFKLDGDGNAVECQLRNLGANADLSFINWSPDMVNSCKGKTRSLKGRDGFTKTNDQTMERQYPHARE